jgi:hypothetical protein
MACLVEDFRSNVIGSATGRVPSLSRWFDPSRQPEISNFDFHLIVKEDIPQFDISMDDSNWMQILKSSNDLQEIVLGLDLCNSDPTP